MENKTITMEKRTQTPKEEMKYLVKAGVAEVKDILRDMYLFVLGSKSIPKLTRDEWVKDMDKLLSNGSTPKSINKMWEYVGCAKDNGYWELGDVSLAHYEGRLFDKMIAYQRKNPYGD